MGLFSNLFGRDRPPEPEPVPDDAPPPEDLVRDYLRAQNLEQVGRTDDAIEHYERAVRFGFDAAGPYDRLIAIYRSREAHAEVARVADAALARVRTYEDRRAFYERMRVGATEALERQPDPSGPEF